MYFKVEVSKVDTLWNIQDEPLGTGKNIRILIY